MATERDFTAPGRSRRIRFARVCTLALIGTLAVAVLIRVTIADWYFASGILFYATPWPVIAAGFAAAGIASTSLFSWRMYVPLATAAAAAALLWTRNSWRQPAPESARGAVRIVLWNVARPDRWLPPVAAWLRSQDADIIALVEAQPKRTSTLERWRELFPDYRLVPGGRNMLCLIRGDVLTQATDDPNGYYCTDLRLRIHGRELRVLQVDFNAHPLHSRRPPFENLSGKVTTLAGEPLIVLGDFNTPTESVYFRRLRQHLSNAYETAGTGWAETWPWPLPLLSLDQMWTTPQLRAVRCEHAGSWESDHKAVVADFDFAPVAPHESPAPTRTQQHGN